MLVFVVLEVVLVVEVLVVVDDDFVVVDDVFVVDVFVVVVVVVAAKAPEPASRRMVAEVNETILFEVAARVFACRCGD